MLKAKTVKANLQNKTFTSLVPYLALWLNFIIYLHYWAEIIGQCPSPCYRGYDDGAYHADFIGLLKGTWPGQEPFFQTPLPAVFLGFLHTIFQYSPESMAVPYLIQLFLALLTCAFTYKLARDAFAVRVGVVAVVLLGLYPFVKFYATTLEVNTLITCTLTAALYFMGQYRRSGRKLFFIIGALCLGLTILGRTNNLALIGAFILSWSLSKVPLRKILLEVSSLLLIISLVLLPAVLHSSRTAGRFVLITFTGVYNFTMGNLPGVSGAYSNQATHTLEPTLQFISGQPLAWLMLLIRKSQLFFTFPWSPAPFLELPFYYICLWSGFILLYFFYFLKSFTPRRNLLHLALLFYAASIIIAHVEDEYRLPILPVLFIFAALLLAHLFSLFSFLFNRANTIITRRQLQKPALVLAGSLLMMIPFILLLPSFQIAERVGVMQEQPAYGGVIVGQNFQVECPYLNQIAVKMFAPVPAGSVSFHLRESSLEGSEIYSQALNTSQLNSANYHYLTFPDIPNSAGKQYTFYFDTAALKTAEEGLFLFGGRPPFAESLTRLDPERYQYGAFIKLGHSAPNVDMLKGNLVFEASCRTTPAILAGAAVERLAGKTPFPKTAAMLLAVLLTLSSATFLGSCLFMAYKIFVGRGATYQERVEYSRLP